MALHLKMSSICVTLSLILIFTQIQTKSEELIGNYSKYTLSSGVNVPECGMRYVPVVRNYSFDDSCYKNKYQPKVLYDIDGNNLMYETHYETEPTGRVFKGQGVGYGEASWTVLLSDMEKELFFLQYEIRHCVGSLITLEWVLTAAHCVRDFQYEVTAYAGSNIRHEGQKRHINPNKKFIHPGFLDASKRTHHSISSKQQIWKQHYDIGLIKLEKPFTRKIGFGRRYLINTICLPTRKHSLYHNKRATFYGWGLREYSTEWRMHGSPKLLKGDVNVLGSDSPCYLRYCARFSGEDSTFPCMGDSGGPLVQYLDHTWTRAVQIGVFKGGEPGYSKDAEILCIPQQVEAAVWVSVPIHIDWILETIENN